MGAIRTIEDLKNASSEEVRQAVKQVSIMDDLQKYLAWLNSSSGGRLVGQFELGHNPHRGLGLHPSVFSKPGTCPLRLYWDITGDVPAKEKISMKQQLTFDIGTMAHHMLQAFCNDMYGDQFEDEVRLKDKGLYIVSSTDGKFEFPKARFLLEIKTIKEGGDFGWAKIQGKPFVEHVRQLHTYMKIADAPFGLIFYFCKNTSECKEHPIIWDDSVWKGIRTQIDPIIEAVKIGVPPEAKPSSACRWCPYQHGCTAGRGYADDRSERTKHLQRTARRTIRARGRRGSR